jgi:hypothetical protein
MRIFSKIKPLTEEEKAQKLAELRDKMAEKRTRKAAEEAKEAKANELIRRKAGKVRLKSGPYAITCGSQHIETGSRTYQRGSKEQADSKRPRRKAPRFVSLTSPHLFRTRRPCRRNVTPHSYRKGERQEGPRCGQGADRGRQATTRAKGSGG